MKLLIFFAAAITVSYGFTQKQIQAMKVQMMNFGEDCQAKAGAAGNDITELLQRRPPSRKEGKCFLLCMHKKIGFQNEDGKVDIPGIKNWLDDLAAMDQDFSMKMKQIADKCIAETDDSGDPCETGAIIYNCYTRVSKEMHIQMMI